MKGKISTWLIAIVITAFVVTALWLWGPAITGYSVYEISSNKPNITITSQLLGSSFDVSESGLNFTDIYILDSNVNEKAMVELITSKINTDVSCTNFTDDCDVTYWFGEIGDYGYGYNYPEGEQIFNGTEISLQKGENRFAVYILCQQYSCPQNISATMIFSLKEKV